MTTQTELPPIHTIRRQRVMLDSDLARLYGVPTHRLNQAIKRNVDRFPADFRFQLTREEYDNLKSQMVISSSESVGRKADAPNSSQFVMSSRKHRGTAYLPWVFTEHGALMAATVLKSTRAVQMSLFVVRAFVQMREEILAHATVFKRLAETIGDKHMRELESLLIRVIRPPGNKQLGKFAGAENLERKFERSLDHKHKVSKSRLMGRPIEAIEDINKPSRVIKLRVRYKGKLVKARFRRDGSVRYNKKIYSSLSAAATAVCKHAVNGWWFWHFERSPGDWVRMLEKV